ncbi:MerR family DNA-binding transcriptional regulator [Mycobacterium sp. KBS0706]|uniref:MerR family transcriptional regulator n=1 Tax=Mycobacterium sp. KBS0706 TaxID=2578109 RepID=UPI00110F87B8|nr:MerR family DNA-binding transcriptional regulator [Mycobacterium sp. KBS0706]TSD88043.1 MerR family DNA-binding transcriptional regulator [Mycobacterium sp. KBS0706]
MEAGIREKAEVEQRSYSIGDLAAAFDITPRSIRFYEDEGLLSPERAGLTRIYSHRDRARLALICRGKRLGFSLAEIREFLDLYDREHGQVGQMSYFLGRARARRAALETQLVDVQQTIEDLKGIEDEIVGFLKREGALPEG